MISQGEFVELDKGIHDRESFDCGKNELNDFIWTKAAKHRKLQISKTMLLPGSDSLDNGKYPICAFYAVSAATVHRENLPNDLAKKLPYYPIPVFLIAQFAVHNDCRGQGLGKITLIEALKDLANVEPYLPSYAVIVDCLDRDAETFYQKYGFHDLCVHNGRARKFLPMGTVKQLFPK